MANDNSGFTLQEFKDETVAVLLQALSISSLRSDTIKQVQQASEPKELIRAINVAIMAFGIGAPYRGDLETIKGLIKTRFPR